MKEKKIKFRTYCEAVAVMVGYIIGVGMFSLPYLTAKAGWVAFLFFLFTLGYVQYKVHLIYANLIIVTKAFHRMPGYVGLYLGKTGKILVFLAKIIGNYGALLAYLIISGTFLYEIFGQFYGGSEELYTFLVFIFSAIVVFFGIRMLAHAELALTGLLLLAVLIMFFKGMPVIAADNFLVLDWRLFFLPYGAMLMALDGNGSLPVVAKMLDKQATAVKTVIRVSMAISVFIMIIFVYTIVGISGSATTPNALSGVKAILNDGVVLVALVFGVFTMISSILGVAEAVKETFWWDFKINRHLSWALAVFVPFFLYLAGINDLIEIISFAGAIAGGFCVFMLMAAFRKMRQMKARLPMFERKPSVFLNYLIITLLILGMLYEINNFFR